MKKEKLLALALKAAANKVTISDVSIEEVIDDQFEENNAYIYLELTDNVKLEENFAIALTNEIFDDLGYETFWRNALNDRYELDVIPLDFEPGHGCSNWKIRINIRFYKELPPKRYVEFGGVKHPFTTEKQKKALIKEAQHHVRYLIVDGISVTAKFSSADCAEIARDCARVRDNKK